MPTFSYVARDREGRLTRGTMEVKDQDELLSSLQQRGLLVTSVALEGKARAEPQKKRERLHRRVKIDDLALMARQLATMLEAGVTLLRALETVKKQISSKRLYLAMEEVKRDVEGGSTLKNALAKHPKVFSEYWLSLVETGESSGKLPQTLALMAHHFELTGSFQRKVVSSSIYPVILIIVAIGAITFFMVRIVPTFAGVFRDFNVPLPALTKIVIQVSTVIHDNLLYILGAILVLGYLAHSYIHTPGGRWRFDQLKLKLPIFGSLFHMIVLDRFTRGLATLVESGVPLLHSLEIMVRTAGNKVMEKALEGVKDGVRDGKTIAGPLAENEIFPPMVVNMVDVGEETGKLGEMLGRVSDFYEERIDVFIARLTTVFEPALIVFMGVVIGVLVISMYLPIFAIARLGGAGG